MMRRGARRVPSSHAVPSSLTPRDPSAVSARLDCTRAAARRRDPPQRRQWAAQRGRVRVGEGCEPVLAQERNESADVVRRRDLVSGSCFGGTVNLEPVR